MIEPTSPRPDAAIAIFNLPDDRVLLGSKVQCADAVEHQGDVVVSTSLLKAPGRGLVAALSGGGVDEGALYRRLEDMN